MTTALYTHASSSEHDTGAGHPERIARIEAVGNALAGTSWDALMRRDAPRATRDQLERVHAGSYLDVLFANIPDEGYAHLDADTVMSPGTGEAALRAAGAIIAAIDDVMTGAADNAFCAVRPPGHHAEPGRGMGFCLLNNVAIGAMHARVAHGLKKIAIVDFDVHHGKRHPGDVRSRCRHALRLDPPVSALPGHRCGERNRHWQRVQRPAGREFGRRRVPRRDGG
jgi:acetoin utilization deacetylase AcuC-like enzyme